MQTDKAELIEMLSPPHNGLMDYSRLLEKSRQLEVVMDALPASIGYVNADRNVEFVNKRSAELLGMPADEITGRNVGDVLGRNAYRAIKPFIERALQGEPQEFEELVPLETGIRWIHANFVPDTDAGGNTRGFFVLSTDVGERKELEQRQQRLLEEATRNAAALSAANHAKDDFLGMVSHELRTPLTTILGNAQILTRRMDLLTPNESRSISDDIYKESVRLTNIVENLLFMARFDAGRKLATEPTVLRGVVSRVVRDVARISDHHFEMEFPTAVVPVSGNETCVEQVLRNLISNAEKYSQAGTTIDVHIVNADDSLVLGVADRGLGIAADETEQIFEPFFRSAAGSTSRSGVGIGLSVCKRLVDAMGGRIWASAREGGGSVFSFSLPKCVENPRAPAHIRSA
jgi:PAS domain S-box-containing protein